MIKSSKKFIWVGAIIIVAVILALFINRNNKSPQSFFEAEKRDLVKEISVTGKVLPVEEINLSFEKSGILEKILVKEKEQVKKGDLLAVLKDKDAQKALQKAQANLEAAQITLEKKKLEYDQLLRGDDLNQYLENGMTILADFYDDLPTYLDDLYEILFGNDLSTDENNIEYYSGYSERFEDFPVEISKLYSEIERDYTDYLAIYQSAQRGQGKEREEAIDRGYELVLKLRGLTKKVRDVVRYLQDLIVSEEVTHKKESTIEDHFSYLSQLASEIDDYQDDLLEVINDVNDYYDQLDNLSLEVKNQESQVKEKEEILAQAKEELAKHYLYSPVDGKIIKIHYEVGEAVSAYSPVLEIISDKGFEVSADIYEEDVVEIELGTPVKISFPAFPKKIYQGRVSFVSPKEKIKDDVVYYEVKISFEKEVPEMVKSNMTVDLIIPLEEKNNVLVVPRSAIFRENGKEVVWVLVGKDIKKREVEIGLRGEEFVEIISGLKEGERVLLR